MAFPNKMYFSLSEVSARWHRHIKDVEYCIENGLLNAHIKVCSVKLTSSIALNQLHNKSQEIYEYIVRQSRRCRGSTLLWRN